MTRSTLPTHVIDDLVEHNNKGYDASETDHAILASEIWLDAWNGLKK